jgi:hypothetical protein
VPFLIDHHLRKHIKESSDDPLEEVSGTLGVTGSADTVLVIKRKRHSPDGTLFVTGRDVEEHQKGLKWNEDDMRWNLSTDAPEATLTEERLKVIELLKKTGPLSPHKVAERLGKKPGAMRKLVAAMYADEQLDKNGKSEYFVPKHDG